MELDREDRRFQKQLNAGATSLALLGLLSRARRPMYGYEIAKQLEASCGGTLPMNQGALYPVLRSLEEQSLLSSHVEPSVTGPARKYYQITAGGRQVLRRWLVAWRRTTQFVDSVLEGKNASQRTTTDPTLPRRTPRDAEKSPSRRR
jgi:PadR family transcriptional regulator PadR